MEAVESVGALADLFWRGFGTALLADVDGDEVGTAESERMKGGGEGSSPRLLKRECMGGEEKSAMFT